MDYTFLASLFLKLIFSHLEFELKEEELDSIVEEESEDEEPQTPAVRRCLRKKAARKV